MPTGGTSAEAPSEASVQPPPEPEPATVGPERTEDPFPAARSLLRQWVYALVLALLAFVQEPGSLVGDTKFDLVVDPGRFMGRALHMWDGSGFFGQIQNQAYGYFFPMGPFFWLGQHVHLDMWVVQRLWWTLVLCTAFFGVLRVSRELGLGRPWTQVVAAFAYALSCHVTTVIGATSIEVWPGALAPWILWCVVRGTTGGSERRWAAAAGLLVAACGGVNAAAVLGALPLGACWLVTRSGRRAWVFAGWWVLATVLATLWWSVPLLVLGRYSFPFLDYIESASVTTLPTGLSDVLGGTSDWVYYYGGTLFPAGYDLATTPYLLLNAAVLAALGLAGIARRDNPRRGFLALALVVGCLLVSFGYTGAGHGWWADTRQAWLDGALAPLRNVHKFDNVLRLPLVLGLAHLLGTLAVVGPRRTTVQRVAAGVAALAVVVTASPWWLPKIPPAGPIASVPLYWRQAGSYLDRHDDGTSAVVVPAASTGLYLWGSPRDDILQPLTHAPWATRNTIPFTQPGAVVLLNAITAAVESGRPDPNLAAELAANGIGRIVVRNDLNRVETGAPDPVALHAVLNGSAGIEREASFGPELGNPPAVTERNGVRVAADGGLSGRWPPVEIYRVTAPVATVETVPDSSVRLAVGGAPGDGLRGVTTPSVLGAPPHQVDDNGVELSDALRRREEDFAEVRSSESATMRPDQRWRLDRPVHQRLMVDDQGRWEATVAWRGIRGVEASSSRAWVDTRPPVDRSAAPDAALDGSPRTAWRSASGAAAVGQWWQVDLLPGTDVDGVRLLLPADTGITRLRLDNGKDSREVGVPAGGGVVSIRTGWGESDHLRVTALAAVHPQESFGLEEVGLGGPVPQRTVELPTAPAGHRVDAVDLQRDPGRAGCLAVRRSLVCRDTLAATGDDGDVLDRTFELPEGGDFTLDVSGSWAGTPQASRSLLQQLPFRLSTTAGAAADLRAGPLAMVDGDPRTAWISSAFVDQPRVELTFPARTTVRALLLRLSPTAAAVPPTAVTVRAGGETRAARVTDGGWVRFAPLRGSRFVVTVRTADLGFDTSDPQHPRPLPTGIGRLQMYGGGGPLLRTGAQELSGACGVGPTITTDGAVVQTAYRATLAEAMRGEVTLSPCTGRVRLAAGAHRVVVRPTGPLLVDHLRLERIGAPATAAPQRLTPSTWTDDHRTVRVAGSPTGRLLVVSQNYNEGWRATLDGTELAPQLVDGWRQGWWLPAGASGTVEMTFTPQQPYRAGLIAGAVGALLVAAAALVRRRPSERPASRPRRAVWGLGAPAMVVAAGLLGGWPAAGAALVLVAALALWPAARGTAYVVAGIALAAAGAWTAYARPDRGLNYEAWVQWVLAAALVLALPLSRRPNLPTVRRRMHGRSTR